MKSARLNDRSSYSQTVDSDRVPSFAARTPGRPGRFRCASSPHIMAARPLPATTGACTCLSGVYQNLKWKRKSLGINNDDDVMATDVERYLKSQ